MKNILCICFLASILLAACKKEANTSTDAEYYLLGKLDGAALKFEINATSDAQIGTYNDAAIGLPNCTFGYGCSIGADFGEPDGKSVTIMFPNLFVGMCGNERATFHGLFKKGAFPFGESHGNVSVSYFDDTESWSTFNGPQKGTSLEITKSEVVESPFGPSQKVGGKFSCVLFNITGKSKKLEGVSFVLSYWPYE